MDRVALDDEAIWEKLSGLERDMNATTMTSDERVRDVQRQLDTLDKRSTSSAASTVRQLPLLDSFDSFDSSTPQ